MDFSICCPKCDFQTKKKSNIVRHLKNVHHLTEAEVNEFDKRIVSNKALETHGTDLAKSDSRLHLISVDVSCDESLQKALKEIEGLVDDRGLNLLINNAAICPPYRTIDPPNRAVVLECLNVNAVGALVTAQLFLPLLRKAAAHTPGSTFSASKAAILNVGSDCASQTLNVTGLCDDTDFAYKMSKTAMLSFSRSMVADFKPLGTPVLVTTMHPGWVLTEMGGPNAKITIEESAADMMKSIGKLNKTHNGGLFDRNLEIMPF